MIQQSVILHFPSELYDKPVISKLLRTHPIEVNILQAHITPRAAGQLFAIVEGEEGAVEDAFAYLDSQGVGRVLPVQNLVWDEEKCVHCGACVGLCRPKAFSFDQDTGRVVFDTRRCIACDHCIPACSYGAIESIREYLKRKEGENGKVL